MRRLGIPWKGELGFRSSFYYEGIFIVATAPGVFRPMDLLGAHWRFIHRELAADNSIWRITTWHKNMRQMQVGGRPGGACTRPRGGAAPSSRPATSTHIRRADNRRLNRSLSSAAARVM